MDYVGRFFEQVYCTYWFYSAEDFYPRLERTMEEGGASASASWLCSIYSVFAIGSMRPMDQGAEAVGSRPTDSKTPTDYLALARELSAGACDEADLDSVKAFGLLVGLVDHADVEPSWLTWVRVWRHTRPATVLRPISISVPL